MTTVTEYTREEFLVLLDNDGDAGRIINRWLKRGDGVAVYENHHLGHPELGHKKFVSFGSIDAQLEPRCATCGKPIVKTRDAGVRSLAQQSSWQHEDGTGAGVGGAVAQWCSNDETGYVKVALAGPPTTLPDIGGAINWRYQLIGTYRGEEL